MPWNTYCEHYKRANLFWAIPVAIMQSCTHTELCQRRMKQKKASLISAANIIHEHNKINGPPAENTAELNNIYIFTGSILWFRIRWLTPGIRTPFLPFFLSRYSFATRFYILKTVMLIPFGCGWYYMMLQFFNFFKMFVFFLKSNGKTVLRQYWKEEPLSTKYKTLLQI